MSGFAAIASGKMPNAVGSATSALQAGPLLDTGTGVIVSGYKGVPKASTECTPG